MLYKLEYIFEHHHRERESKKGVVSVCMKWGSEIGQIKRQDDGIRACVRALEDEFEMSQERLYLQRRGGGGGGGKIDKVPVPVLVHNIHTKV